MKLAVVYWTGSGNTKQMAEAIVAGAKEAGAEASLIFCTDFAKEQVAAYDALAFGCPAMGAEMLEESDFEPMFAQVEGELAGKKVALFGSYGWGDGEWMRTWESRCAEKGITLATESLIVNDAPDAQGVQNCRMLGSALVKE